MGWYKAHSSLNRAQGSIDLIDRCINCGSEKRIKANITMEFYGLGKLITEATFFVECWMDAETIKAIIKEEDSKKAIYSEHK